jgi:hypothetical protein
MSKNEDNRVLARAGARCLTEQELTCVQAGFNTDSCSRSLFPPYVMDGDACI